MLDIITVHPKKEILDYPQNRRWQQLLHRWFRVTRDELYGLL